MLKLDVPAVSLWDETSEMFVELPKVTLELEHSLVSLAKWESKWKKPFLNDKEHTVEETRDYVRCMSLNTDVDSMVFDYLDSKIMDRVNEYVADTMTATTITKYNEHGSSSLGKKEVITAEIIYYWMIALQIPMECQYWHLNRLMMLIRVCAIKSENPKKMKGTALAKHNHSLNHARRKAKHSKG